MLVNENDVYMGQALLKYGECCELELAMLLQLIRLPGLVIEVGANMGIHSIPLATELQRQGRKMIVVEPQQVIFQQLCANLALNSLLNVTAYPYACGDKIGTASFFLLDYRARNNFGGVSMSLPEEGTNHPITTAPCVRLDDLVPHATPAIGVVKIDVEGMELDVLKGATLLIERFRPALYIENDRPEKSQLLIQWLWDHDYQMWWHVPPLFNPNNFFNAQENVYGDIVSWNMVCLPRSMQYEPEGMEKIVDAHTHPLMPTSKT